MSINPSEIKGLIDSTPSVALLVELATHYASRHLPPAGIDSEEIFGSPRSQVMVRTCLKGTTSAPTSTPSPTRSSWWSADPASSS